MPTVSTPQCTNSAAPGLPATCSARPSDARIGRASSRASRGTGTPRACRAARAPTPRASARPPASGSSMKAPTKRSGCRATARATCSSSPGTLPMSIARPTPAVVSASAQRSASASAVPGWSQPTSRVTSTPGRIAGQPLLASEHVEEARREEMAVRVVEAERHECRVTPKPGAGGVVMVASRCVSASSAAAVVERPPVWTNSTRVPRASRPSVGHGDHRRGGLGRVGRVEEVALVAGDAAEGRLAGLGRQSVAGFVVGPLPGAARASRRRASPASRTDRSRPARARRATRPRSGPSPRATRPPPRAPSPARRPSASPAYTPAEVDPVPYATTTASKGHVAAALRQHLAHARRHSPAPTRASSPRAESSSRRSRRPVARTARAGRREIVGRRIGGVHRREVDVCAVQMRQREVTGRVRGRGAAEHDVDVEPEASGRGGRHHRVVGRQRAGRHDGAGASRRGRRPRTNSSLRALLPPRARPLQSSRFIQRSSPSASPRRRNGTSGVGQWPSATRGSGASAASSRSSVIVIETARSPVAASSA